MSRVVLVEAGPRVLPSFPESLSAKAKRALERLGVEVWLGTPVTACDECGATVGAERIESRTIFWAAGVAASPAAKWLDAEKDHAGRVFVGPNLTLPSHPEIFVLGDTCNAKDTSGKPFPGVAPVAKQQGVYAATTIRARIGARAEPPPFRYRDLGNLATIGVRPP
jgi:NADH dehydrogenase